MNGKLKKKLVFLLGAGALSIMFLVIGGYQLYEYTESTAFCGKLCHTVMDPEYATYQASPHSRVTCAACHVGPGADYLVKSKIRGIPQIFATVFNTYPRPITSPVANLRPATDTCEQCHRPEYFSGDLVKNVVTYNTDEQNTEVSSTMVMRVGGGFPQTATGIHWHISAKVWYLPMDEQRQEIGWVGVEALDGSLTEYVNPDYVSELGRDVIDKDKRLMDCVDCHNRATHIFYSPEELIDSALQDGRIDISIPYVKREALSRLSPLSPTVDDGHARVQTILEYYQTNYPQFYTNNQDILRNLVTEMDEIVTLTVFPEMNVSYQTHVNNLGHINSDGCFRCHTKLVNTEATSITVSGTCDTCHYNQSVSLSDQPPYIPHTLVGRSDCLSCHGSSGTDPVSSTHTGRTNNTCTSCHLVETGITEEPAPDIPHTLAGRDDCLSCHGPSGVVPVSFTHTGRSNDTCTSCHAVGSVTIDDLGPDIPHSVAGITDCLSCHSSSGFVPVSASHAGRTNITCSTCHSPASSTASIPIPHTLTGDCVSCHGAGQIVPYPVNHRGWPNTSCSLCHTAQPVSVASIPHSISSLTECASCHRVGTTFAYPSSHSSWTIDTCTLCHRLQPVSARRIPHSISGRTDCLVCHGRGGDDDEGIPRSHLGYTSAACLLCHSR